MTATLLLCATALLTSTQAAPPRKTSPAQARPPVAAAQPYEAGHVYTARDVVALGEKHRLSVKLVKSPAAGDVAVELAIGGPVAGVAFTFGSPASAITLVAGEQAVAASSAAFDTGKRAADEGAPQLVTRMRTAADTGTLVLDTNEHPLVVTFELPAGAARDHLRLVLKRLSVGRDDYSLSFELMR